jgi:glucose/arabinose dehydrogenase
MDCPGETIADGLRNAEHRTTGLSRGSVIAASGLDFYKGNLFRVRKNSLFVGALRGMMPDHLDISGGTAVAEGPLLVDSMSRVRDVRIGSDGAANVIADAGKLPKLTPQ